MLKTYSLHYRMEHATVHVQVVWFFLLEHNKVEFCFEPLINYELPKTQYESDESLQEGLFETKF